MILIELKQLVNDFHILWMNGDRDIFFALVGLIFGLWVGYYGLLAVITRLLKTQSELRFEFAAIGMRALLFGIGWVGLSVFFRDGGTAEELARQFLWVYLGVGVLGRGVMRLPWPRTFQWHLQTILILAGYGGFWLVPSLVSYNSSLGWLLNGVVIAAVAIILARLVWAQRARVNSLLLATEPSEFGFIFSWVLRLVAPIWHWLILVGTLGVAIPSIVQGPTVAGLLGLSVAQTAVYVAVALGISRLLEAFLAWEQYLPAAVSSRYPAFANRVSLWMPRLLRVLQGFVAVLLVIVLMQAWRVFGLNDTLFSPVGLSFLQSLGTILLILVLTGVVWLLVMSWIEDRLNPDIGQGAPGSREKTLLTLFRNAAAIAILVMASMILLAELGINIGPLIAGAGVIGLAVGFGAQKLVQDIITGIFIQIEDAIHADDYITAAGISGTVERLSLRSIALRDLTGTLHIIPFSSVDLVSNFTRDFGYHLGVYGVAYRENIGEVIEQLHVAYDRLLNAGDVAEAVAGPLEMDGVTALDNSSVNIRVRIRTTPGMQWAVGRAFNRIVKETFDEAGIEIPFPQMAVWFGEDKAGKAPPAPLRILKEE